MTFIKKIANSPLLMSYASRFVNFGQPLLITPLVLAIYTENEQNFFWFTTTIIIFAMLADSGFGSALIRAVGYFRAGADYLPKNKDEYDNNILANPGKPNIEKLQGLLATVNAIYILLSLLVIILVGLMFFAIGNIMEMNDQRIDLWIGYFLLFPQCIQLVLIVKWRSFIRGLNYVAYVERIAIYFGVIRTISIVIMLSFGLSPTYLILYGVIGTTVRLQVYRRFVRKWFKANGDIKAIKRNRFDKKIFASLWPQTWRLAGIFWGNFLVEKGNTLVVAQISDPLLMAKFLFTSRILDFIKSFSQTTLNAYLPSIYKLGAEKNFKLLREKCSQYLFLALIIIIGGYLFIGVLGNPIINLLDRYGILDTNTRFVPTYLLIFMTLTIILDMHSTFHASIYSSTNHIPFLIPSLVSGAVIVGFGYSYVLGVYGLIGIILLRFFVQLSFNNWYATFLSLRLLKWPFFRYLYEVPVVGISYYTNRLKKIL